MLKKLLLTGLLLTSGALLAAGRIEVMRFGKEIQYATLEKGASETFHYNDGIIITVTTIDEEENGVIARVTAAVGSADFYTTEEVVAWDGVLTIAEPQSDEVITITFSQVKDSE
ncbi:hypothetical protein KC460_03805 [Candidatus Dependentiae bacterium]|nr:hypothetical protein [Candidatus Dependentiae bacterium]